MPKKSQLFLFLRLHGQSKFAREVAGSGAALEALGMKGAEAIAKFARSAERLKGEGDVGPRV